MSDIIGKRTAAGTSEWFHWKGGLCTIWVGIRDDQEGTDHYDFGGNTVSLECSDAEVATGARPLTQNGQAVEATTNAVINMTLGPCYLRFIVANGGACDVGVKATAVRETAA